MSSEKHIVVQKYGGSSVADPQKLKVVAELIKKKRDLGKRLCVVVSAMGQTTNDLLAKANEVSQAPSRRELDMLLSCGERASMALLAMALESLGVPSISFTGSQSGIITNDQHSNARILEVRPYRVQDELAKDKVVIIAGYQGVSYKKEITTLGRGGSDTTAVAMAAALEAEACEIYSDVDGVYTADPRVVTDAVPLSALSYDEMLSLSKGGARVLNAQAVAYAKEKNIALYAKKTGSSHNGTIVLEEIVDGETQPWAFAHRDMVNSYQSPQQLSLTQGLKALKDLEIEPLYWVHAGNSWCYLVAPEDAHGHQKLTVDGWSPMPPKGAITAVKGGLGQDLDTVTHLVRCVEEKSSPDQVHVTENSVTFVLQSNHVQAVLSAMHHEFLVG